MRRWAWLSLVISLLILCPARGQPARGEVSPLATPTLTSPLATPTPGLTPTPTEEWFALPGTGTPHPLAVKLLTFTAR